MLLRRGFATTKNSSDPNYNPQTIETPTIVGTEDAYTMIKKLKIGVMGAITPCQWPS